MATTYKVLGQSYPTAATATSLYTVPSATSAVVSTLNVANLSSSSDTVRIAVRPAGASLSNQHYLAYNMQVPGTGMLTITIGMSLATTDVITVYSSAGTCSFVAFGSEIS